MSEKIVTLEELMEDDIFQNVVVWGANQCNLDLQKVYDKMKFIVGDDNNDVEYINRRLPNMISDFVFGYRMCYNAHVKYNSANPYFEKKEN